MPFLGMSRATLLKLVYPVLAVLLLAGSIALMTVGDGGWGLLAFFFLLLVPGRVQGAVYRDLHRGRSLYGEGKFAEAIPCFERFLARIRRRPALKLLVWLRWTAYTASVEAMALNNLGSAAIGLGDLEAAEEWLRQALRVDPRYPMPYYNLAVVAQARGDDAETERLLGEASRLGFTGGRFDQALQQAAQRLAHAEGGGPRPPFGP